MAMAGISEVATMADGGARARSHGGWCSLGRGRRRLGWRSGKHQATWKTWRAVRGEGATARSAEVMLERELQGVGIPRSSCLCSQLSPPPQLPDVLARICVLVLAIAATAQSSTSPSNSYLRRPRCRVTTQTDPW
jgi:hypothetical protein